MSEWTTPATIISLLSMLGLGYLAPKVLTKTWQGLTGRAKRSREETDRLRAELAAARAETDAKDALLDIESAWRRRLQEALSATRIVAREHGVPENNLPSFPGRPEPKEKPA